jgi:tetratricopeptide (TPR) repeat protein
MSRAQVAGCRSERRKPERTSDLALFGRKKTGEDAEPNGGAAGTASDTGAAAAPAETPGNGGVVLDVHPDKARKFFEYAKTVHETTNYEYAMQLWLNGLRHDPGNVQALESFMSSCQHFLAASGGKSLGKDTVRLFSGRGDVERYLLALLQWGMRPADATLAVRAADSAARLGLAEPTYWIGSAAMGAVGGEKRPRKDLFVRLKEIFIKVGAYDKAVEAGEAAVRLDPTDGPLIAEIRNLAAQATMSRGGFEDTGQAGGFRANIRDADRQRMLEEQERIVKTDETIDRLVLAAEADYRSRSEDPAAINVYAKRLLERGRPEDEKRAREVLRHAYETTRQFRFREMDGDVRLRQAHRKLMEYKHVAESNPDNPGAQEMYRKAQQSFLKIELEEYQARVDAYPTDLGYKFELGKRFYQAGEFEQAIAMFQRSQEDVKRRVESLKYLGQSFMQIGWVDEAVHTFRQAMDHHHVHTDETGLDLRYGLLTALQAKAEADRDLSIAEEADRLASSIAIQQINFRDIRARRDVLKKLIADLKRGDAA